MLKLLWAIEGLIIASLILIAKNLLFPGIILLLILAVIVGIILFGAIKATSVERSLE